MKVEEFWNDFLNNAGLPAETKLYASFYFCMTEEWANKLLQLVLDGQKKATSSSLWGYEKTGEDMPVIFEEFEVIYRREEKEDH